MSRKKKEADQEVSMKEFLDASMELEQLRRENGVEPEEKGLSRMVSRFFDWRANREKVLVSRKKYLLVMVLLGWCGGHRFMAKQYFLGALYLAFFWTGFPLAMTIIDLLTVIPIPPDENGNILV